MTRAFTAHAPAGKVTPPGVSTIQPVQLVGDGVVVEFAGVVAAVVASVAPGVNVCQPVRLPAWRVSDCGTVAPLTDTFESTYGEVTLLATIVYAPIGAPDVFD
jgi:hypothetical protein